MIVQRYFVKKEDMTDRVVTIKDEDYHHITRVMRMETGDRVICSDGSRSALCELKDFSNETVTATIVNWIKEPSELPVDVTIAQALPKADKLETVVQKGTELGAVAFLPFRAQRSVVKWTAEKTKKKIARLKKIAKEAAEQAHRERVPRIADLAAFDGLIQHGSNYDVKIVAFEEEANNTKALPSTLTSVRSGQSILFVTGPEGGLTEHEVAKLKQCGFVVCGLGPRILRTETAPLYFLAAVSYQTELLR